MTRLNELLARDRRTDVLALRDEANDHQYDYRRFCTTAWKVGNLLHHFGVRTGTTVVVAGRQRPEPILSVLGTALLGGTVRVGSEIADARALIAPTVDFDSDTRQPGTHRIGYGERPTDPSDTFFEQDVWRENPTQPPGRVAPDTPLVETTEATYTHKAVFSAAQSVVDRWDLTADTTVAVRAPLKRPETIVAGVVAPLMAGATVLLPDGGVGDCAVVAETGPESRTLTVDAIDL
ncbi:acyl-CoA synthetase family protein [Halocatena pleomorpha]|uniref:Acetyl-CoA synthetase n=1 Tax=Halocatena pleomorpha TaxID=1785090 RepID=A0A3P3RIK6_9EURY|nr:hypothetical protein [Halocatena pleomorpha]RRJ32659.1 hypothetical protein EIK79_04165 [Halocatena pleomorpha]